MATRTRTKPQNEAIPPQPDPVIQEVDIVQTPYPDFEVDSDADYGENGGVQELPDDESDFEQIDTDIIDDSEPIDVLGAATTLTPQQAAAGVVAPPGTVTATVEQLEAEVERRVAERLAAASVPVVLAPQTVTVVETPIEVEKPAAKTFILRTNIDVGPIFYGHDEIHLIKGVKYRVPEHIFLYLEARDLIYSRS
jgi:hypothetical protein